MAVERPRPPDEPSAGAAVVPDAVGLDVERVGGGRDVERDRVADLRAHGVGESRDARRGARGIRHLEVPGRSFSATIHGACSCATGASASPMSWAVGSLRTEPPTRLAVAGRTSARMPEPAERVVVRTTMPAMSASRSNTETYRERRVRNAVRVIGNAMEPTSFRVVGPVVEPLEATLGRRIPAIIRGIRVFRLVTTYRWGSGNRAAALRGARAELIDQLASVRRRDGVLALLEEPERFAEGGDRLVETSGPGGGPRPDPSGPMCGRSSSRCARSTRRLPAPTLPLPRTALVAPALVRARLALRLSRDRRLYPRPPARVARPRRIGPRRRGIPPTTRRGVRTSRPSARSVRRPRPGSASPQRVDRRASRYPTGSRHRPSRTTSSRCPDGCLDRGKPDASLPRTGPGAPSCARAGDTSPPAIVRLPSVSARIRFRSLDGLPDRRRTSREERSDPRIDRGLFSQVSGVACVDQRGLEVTLGVPELPAGEPHL